MFHCTKLKMPESVFRALKNQSWNRWKLVDSFVKNGGDVNVRDKNGHHFVHYFLPDSKFGKFRYEPNVILDLKLRDALRKLISVGADINALVNGNPKTLLLNMAAYRSCYDLLKLLMNFEVPFSDNARPLYYVMLPFERGNFICASNYDLDDNYDNREYRSHLQYVKYSRYRCIEFVVKGLLLRRELGLFVPKEEINLMAQLVAARDNEVEDIVNNYEFEYFVKSLRTSIVYYGNDSIKLMDIAKKVFDDKSLKLLVRDEEFVKAVGRLLKNYEDTYGLFKVIEEKIAKVFKWRKLMKKIEETRRLKKFIPLPFEIVLIIVEDLGNEDLRNFVDAFY